MLQGLGMIMEGNIDMGVANLMPKGVKDIIKAISYSTHGVRKMNAQRDVLLTPDEYTLVDAVLQGLGWPSSKFTDRANVSRYLTDTRESFKNRSEELRAAYTEAIEANDFKARNEVMQEWNAYQDSRISQGFKPQPITTLTSALKDKRKREQETVNGIPVSSTERKFAVIYQ